MSVLQDVDAELAALDRDLAFGDLAPNQAVRLRARVAKVREQLGRADAAWVSAAEAQHLLGVANQHILDAWIQLGLLRSRTLPEGDIQVRLEDILRRADEQRQLDEPSGAPMTQREMDELAEARSGTTPWERTTQRGPSSSAA